MGEDKVCKLRTREVHEQSQIPPLVLTLTTHKDDEPGMLQYCLTDLSGAEVAHIRAPAASYRLGDLRAAVAGKTNHHLHKLEILPTGAIVGENPLARGSDANVLTELLRVGGG